MILLNGKNVIKNYFPAGEANVNVAHAVNIYDNMIDFKYESDGDFFELMLVVDAIRRMYADVPISLCIPYIPYGRQDRVSNRGEALGVCLSAVIINGCGFNRVLTVDPHSDVTPALIQRLEIEDVTLSPLADAITKYPMAILVAPDAGASKRVQSAARTFGISKVIQCHKERDTATGKLTGFSVDYKDQYAKLNNPLIVVDDICDGGGTFIGLAPLLKEVTTGPLILYVSHGIFSKGKDELLKHYTEVISAY